MPKRLLIVYLILIPSLIFCLENGQAFSSSTNWNGYDFSGKEIIKGELNRTVHIMECNKDRIYISVFMEMTPFASIVEFKTQATIVDGKYCFSCEDNWGNVVEGYFIENSNGILFYIDILKPSENGKNLARFYGEMIQLTIDE